MLGFRRYKNQMRNAFEELAEQCIKAGMTLVESRKAMSQAYVHRQLVNHDWNQTHAAKACGIHRNTLARDIDLFNIDAELQSVKTQRKLVRRGKSVAAAA